ncbi:diguanylate cyclase domain-containing protein [Psychrobacillus soli]|uniref:Diguanylate cyclase n=1 Tax=Psychrobacillus soli TaxID=1543965 RepID=A0A544T9V5_9BACI|nr:diguanylate cyclase [Psychrobacillus soli]TQR14241.1 diguanylate cyclase [Psychrobacillus soli]
MSTFNTMISNPSLEEYLLIWENTNDAIFILRKDGAIIQANPAFAKILGWSLDEVKNLSKIPFFEDDFTSEDHEKQLDLLRSGKSISYFETKRKHKNGEIKDILASYRSINKKDVLAVAMYKDITEEKQTQRMLRLTENCYRTLVEYSPDAIIVQSSGKITFVNPQALHIIGAKKDTDIIGTSLLDYMDIGNIESENELIRLLRQEEMVKIEPTIQQLTRMDGSNIWVEIIAIPVKFEGEIVIQAIIRDVTVREYYEDQLTYMATHDPMTDVVNRSTFMEEMDKRIEEAKVTKEMLALLFIDLDKFKEVNDTLGHGIGDSLLIQFSKRMKENVRHEDIIGRIGGDEFLILLKDIDKNKINNIMKRMHANFKEPYVIDGKEIIATSSIGVAFYPDDAISPEKLMGFADEALYKAKEVRNHFQYFNIKPQ